jgi:GNAT superfamily N-acetyltransferase
VQITPISLNDFEHFWPIFKAVISAQQSYTIDPEISYDEAFEMWCLIPQKTFVSKQDVDITGSYYLKPVASGPGSHICTCAYMVAEDYRGQGIAREMCLHSQRVALDEGFEAMQFNAVVASNESAIKLWKDLGFSIVGTIPNAYEHKVHGLVDTHIMYKSLSEDELNRRSRSE